MKLHFVSRSFFQRQPVSAVSISFLLTLFFLQLFAMPSLAFPIAAILVIAGVFYFRKKKDFRLPLLFAFGVAFAGVCLYAAPFWKAVGEMLSRSFFGSALASLRSFLTDKLSALKHSGFYIAVLLGDRSRLPEDLRALFTLTGSGHLLALSGLHVSVILGFFTALVFPLPGSKKKYFVLIGLSLFFMVLTGLSASVVRSALIASFGYAGRLARRKTDSVTALFFSGMVICTFSPAQILEAGFLLSFLATFAVLMIAMPVTKLLLSAAFAPADQKPPAAKRFFFWGRRLLAALLSAFAVSLSVVAFTLPVQLSFFSSLSQLSPIYNLVLIPLLTPCLFSGMNYLVASLFGDAVFFQKIADFFASVLIGAERFFAKTAVLFHFSPTAGKAAAVCIAVFWLCFFLAKPHVRTFPFLILFPFFIFFFWALLFSFGGSAPYPG